MMNKFIKFYCIQPDSYKYENDTFYCINPILFGLLGGLSKLINLLSISCNSLKLPKLSIKLNFWRHFIFHNRRNHWFIKTITAFATLRCFFFKLSPFQLDYDLPMELIKSNFVSDEEWNADGKSGRGHSGNESGELIFVLRLICLLVLSGLLRFNLVSLFREPLIPEIAKIQSGSS